MNRRILCLLVLILALLPLVVQAQVQPTSGVIPFSGSMPGQADGAVALRFRLFPVASGGTQCFEETQTVTVATETFFAFIGDATTGGIAPDPCFTTNTSLWVAFAMDGTPDVEIGARTSITSSGYAHFAVPDNVVTTAKIQDMAVTGTKIEDSAITSAKIAVGSVDSSKIVDGSIGASQVDSTQVQRRVIGSCDLGNAIQGVNADGTVTCQAVGTGTIDGGGTANFIPRFTDTTTIGNSAISVVDNTITSPLRMAAPLTVSPNSTAFALEISQGINGNGFQTYVNTTSPDRTVFSATSNVPGLTVKGNGDVGIGTVSLSAKLDVRATNTIALSASSGGTALQTSSTFGLGVLGRSTNNTGVWGQTSSPNNPGIVAISAGASAANLGLQVFGRGIFTGTVSKPAGSFKIDHPLDPANKYLLHSFVESPDMMNVYNGNVILDTNGEAWVELPHYFETLNKDFRYQLTSIGSFAPVYIAEEISGNRFKIAGGKSGGKVSWQVTGIRQDPFAEKYRIPVEEEKPAAERGYYMHPELYGQPKSQSVAWARDPEGMKRMVEEGEQPKSSDARTAALP